MDTSTPVLLSAALAPDSAAALIATRQTIHHFDPSRPVPSDVLAAALEAAVQAPNHKHTEPWRFYVLGNQTRDRLVALNAEVVGERQGAEAAENKRRRWQEVPAFVVVTCRQGEDALRAREDYAATACAVQNLTLLLWSAGIGTKWTTGPVTRDMRFHELIGMKAHEGVVALLHIGYPAEVPPPRQRDAAPFTHYLP